MRAARMYGYKQPLRLEDIPIPEIGADEVRQGRRGGDVPHRLPDGASADCRWSFRSRRATRSPAGWTASRCAEGLPGGGRPRRRRSWGDETCTQCLNGNQQICAHGRWAGFGPHGGYAEYLPVPAKHVIRVPGGDLTADVLAPLTDAGLTPYRGIKKLAKAGALGPGRTVAVLGAGGLGVYAVQYAKLLGAGSTVVALARTDDKLELAKRNGADHTINTRASPPPTCGPTRRAHRGVPKSGDHRLRRCGGDHPTRLRHAGDRRRVRVGGPGGREDRDSALPVRRPRILLLRFVLGEPSRPARGPGVGTGRKGQALDRRSVSTTSTRPSSGSAKATSSARRHRLRLNGSPRTAGITAFQHGGTEARSSEENSSFSPL